MDSESLVSDEHSAAQYKLDSESLVPDQHSAVQCSAALVGLGVAGVRRCT